MSPSVGRWAGVVDVQGSAAYTGLTVSLVIYGFVGDISVYHPVQLPNWSGFHDGSLHRTWILFYRRLRHNDTVGFVDTMILLGL